MLCTMWTSRRRPPVGARVAQWKDIVTLDWSASRTLVAFSSARRREPVPDRGVADSDGHDVPVVSASDPADVPLPLGGRDRERALLDAWREAHWSLRVKLQEVKRQCGSLGIEPLYDQARRCDNLLNEFYQARAEVLARQLRDAVDPHATAASPENGREATRGLAVVERALLARFRALSPEDRTELLHLAVRLSAPAAVPRRGREENTTLA